MRILSRVSRHSELSEEGKAAGDVDVQVHPRFGSQDRQVIIDMGAVSSVDYSAVHELFELPAAVKSAGYAHVHVWLVNLRGPVRDMLRCLIRVHGTSTRSHLSDNTDWWHEDSESHLNTGLLAVDVDTAVRLLQLHTQHDVV